MATMRHTASLSVLLALGACTGPSDSEGYADVTGHVFLASGAPFPTPTVTVECAGGAFSKSVPGDSLGLYQMALTAQGTVMTSSGSRVRCSFRASGSGRADIQLDTTIGFGPAGMPHPLQFVDLRQAASP